ncbi:MAG TPA: transcription-repair coupling factor [Clostridiales bacterium]|nr:transcription-repair coupling factor [Clostridiales bacterium]
MTDMNCLVAPLFDNKPYSDLLRLARQGVRDIRVFGPADSQKAHFLFALCSRLDKKGVLITFHEAQARKMHADLDALSAGGAVLFPAGEALLHSVEARSHDSMNYRITALARILSGDFRYLVTSVEAFAQKLPHPGMLSEGMEEIAAGMDIHLDALSNQLVRIGYDRTHTVEGRGQFAIRGGILDIFPIQEDLPVRIEFFGDTVDTVRSFDPVNQRSTETRERVMLLPAREVLFPREDLLGKVVSGLRREVLHLRGQLDRGPVAKEIDRIEDRSYFPGMDKYAPYLLGDQPCTLIDYLSPAKNPAGDPEQTLSGYLICMDEPARIENRLESLLVEYHESCRLLIEKGMMLAGGAGFYFESEEARRRLEQNSVISFYSLPAGKESSEKDFVLKTRQIPPMEADPALLAKDLAGWKSQRKRVALLAGNPAKAERIAQTLSRDGVDVIFLAVPPKELTPGILTVMPGNLLKGFSYEDAGLMVLTEGDLASRKKQEMPGRRKHRRGISLSSFADLKPGDHVVHDAHGIGLYEGIEKVVVDGVAKDYIKIAYHGDSRLFVPAQQISLVQKYVGPEGRSPRLSRFGGGEWEKTKARVRESLKDMAEELVSLYAKRQELKGFAFSRDTVWQQQFEAEFPYEETEDQLRCVEEIKVDMESVRPMDRLLCGDVGYGKTEVGLRAVFKAVMDGKQAAWLVPTTVLAQQHYESFRQRFSGYPMTVEMLSRFRSEAEQKQILSRLGKGKVDILVGTHRLLQRDIRFKDLGLLVIDEEHRFGVAHKEKLKTRYPEVDVLSLSATPIPRTLHMSMTGIRDISTIHEPPEARYPVQTYVMEYDSGLIGDAISREMARDGQVFYLYNRIGTIHEKAARIRELVPEARVAFAHGQMEERELGNIMMAFLKKEIDILVCTTIIESGLDMGNVNTIIIEDADRLGLAQLYQLRGRVGRAGRLAYAYVTYRRDKTLTEIAEKRLKAIREFTEFGSGFRIAMRDMEIRGAGDILGARQHGHMETVGYEMYCRLLAEAVRITRGDEKALAAQEATVEIHTSALIPRDYIPEESERIEIYERIAAIREEKDLLDVRDELSDRFGHVPPEVEALCGISLIRAYATRCGIGAVYSKPPAGIVLKFLEKRQVPHQQIVRLTEKHRGKILFTAGNPSYITCLTRKEDGPAVVRTVIQVLADLMGGG